MRIISGTARGRKLFTLDGNDVRPTTDLVKESMFNIIQFDIEGRRVLDLFGGTGQLGIEALSRGADSAVFVDSSKESINIIKKNINHAGFSDRSGVVQADFRSFLSDRHKNRFGLIFLDPPYGGEVLNEALSSITQFDILQPGGIIVCESARNDKICDISHPYTKGREYFYGGVKLTIIHREG